MTTFGVPNELVDASLLEQIAADLDLRRPNARAVSHVAARIAEHAATGGGPYHGVIDVATGVGKTYIVAGLIDYLATASGVRNFMIVTPGRTILDKTIANFTVGSTKSLLNGMRTRPVVITSDSFATAATRTAMDDDQQVKLFVFTVQAIQQPSDNAPRRAHAFQEALGESFYTDLASHDDLVVFADEYHCYSTREKGEPKDKVKAFYTAIFGLDPWAVVGLTATPGPGDPVEFRYPLADAIADRLVKAPVIVGRSDDLDGEETKLRDGLTLLAAKRAAVAGFLELRPDTSPVNPVMLVVCKEIAHARQAKATLLATGELTDEQVLEIHSGRTTAETERSLEALEHVEDIDSPVRVILSVGMLKEGWDVKNVYVIVSIRPSISQVLTEQTLGRGLRLPFGSWTGIEILDTLEVVAHERYRTLLQMLKKDRVFKESPVEWRLAELAEVPGTNGSGEQEHDPDLRPVGESAGRGTANARMDEGTIEGVPALVTSVEDRIENIDLHPVEVMHPRPGTLPVDVPVVNAIPKAVPFSLTRITDTDEFRRLGERLALEPRARLLRVLVEADRDEEEATHIVARDLEGLEAATGRINKADAVKALTDRLVGSEGIEARPTEVSRLADLIDAFVAGLGERAEMLGAFITRAADEIGSAIARHRRKDSERTPDYDEAIGLTQLSPVRPVKPDPSRALRSRFHPHQPYCGFKKSAFDQDWFSSSLEREAALAFDASPDVSFWVRLQTGDLPIQYSERGKQYNPDFIVVERDGTHWLVETKADRDADDPVVVAKKRAAEIWTALVRSNPDTTTSWKYLLIFEADVVAAKNDWAALRQRVT